MASDMTKMLIFTLILITNVSYGSWFPPGKLLKNLAVVTTSLMDRPVSDEVSESPFLSARLSHFTRDQ